MRVLSCFVCFFVFSSFLLSKDYSGSVIYIEEGGLIFEVPSSDFQVGKKLLSKVKRDSGNFVYKRNMELFKFCIASTQEFFVPYDGHLIIIPEFESEWLGAIDPSQENLINTAQFEVYFEDKVEIMQLPVELYQKRWLSEHKEDGSHFYIAKLKQEKFQNYRKLPTFSFVMKVQENDSFRVCLSHVYPGTEFQLKSISMIVYPVEPS